MVALSCRVWQKAESIKTMDIGDTAVIKVVGQLPRLASTYDHIGVFRPETPLHDVKGYLTYEYCSKFSAQHGGVAFPANVELYGHVEFRYIHWDSTRRQYVAIGRSPTLHIGPVVDLKVEETPGCIRPLWVVRSARSLAPDAWIGLFEVGAMDHKCLAKQNVQPGTSDLVVQGETFAAGTHGSTPEPFVTPTDAGAYEFRLFSGGSRPVATSEEGFDVDGPGSLTCSVDGTKVTIDFDLTDLPFNVTGSDWIGLFRCDETPAAYLFYRRSALRRHFYVTKKKGTHEEQLVHNGVYEARFIRADGVTVKRSSCVTIDQGMEG